MEIFSPARGFNVVGILAVVVGIVFLVFFLSSTVVIDSVFSYPKLTEEVGVESDPLDTALEAAATNDKVVIITVVNKAYAVGEGEDPVSMLDLFLESFWVGEKTRSLIDNLLVVATDQTAYERCVFRGLHCYHDEMDGQDLSGEKVYMSKGFINMMWRRTFFLLNVLRKGYSFIFTDTDVMWLRNPLTRLNTSEAEDIAISTDWFNGNPRSEKNYINSGFYYARSSHKTISLFERWYNMKDNSTGMKEQDVLQKLLSGGVWKELNISSSFLDTRYFSGFCKDSEEFDEVVTVHANCCVHIRSKVRDLLRVLSDWKRYRALPMNHTTRMVWSEHVNCDLIPKKHNVTGSTWKKPNVTSSTWKKPTITG